MGPARAGDGEIVGGVGFGGNEVKTTTQDTSLGVLSCLLELLEVPGKVLWEAS